MMVATPESNRVSRLVLTYETNQTSGMSPRRLDPDQPRTRLSVYLDPAEFAGAKAAYLVDWNQGGQADTFAAWISAAIEQHAARTTGQRAPLERRKDRADTRTGMTRSFNIPEDVVTRMRAASTADQQAGRWLSDSAWCGDAIAAATEEARRKAGGTLPTPPPRLPNRLQR